MGGNAIKSTYIKRYNAKEYFNLWDEVSYIIHDRMNWVGYLLPAYRNKDSFGDMDILILHNKYVENPKKQIYTYFSPNEIFHNGGVYSFDYKKFQIDFIITPEYNWESSINFYSYNDLGNFIGKIAHKFGLKYSFEGLKYVYRIKNESKILGEIILSKNFSKILSFLGFDYNKWLNGFDTKEDIFEYIITSKYFNFDIFLFDNLNSVHRHRNKNRKMYFDFIEYCYKRKNMPKNYIFYDNKLKYHDMINQAFPGFKNKLKKFEEKDKINSKIKKKFNGNIIMDHIHFLRGNELGEFINDYKKSKKNFDKFIIDNSQNEIISDFKKFYKNEFKNK